MLKQLIHLANHLDKQGLKKEADYLDRIINKMAQDSNKTIVQYRIKPGDNFSSITKRTYHDTGMTFEEALKANMELNPDVDPKRMRPDDVIDIWSTPEAEGNVL